MLPRSSSEPASKAPLPFGSDPLETRDLHLQRGFGALQNAPQELLLQLVRHAVLVASVQAGQQLLVRGLRLDTREAQRRELRRELLAQLLLVQQVLRRGHDLVLALHSLLRFKRLGDLADVDESLRRVLHDAAQTVVLAQHALAGPHAAGSAVAAHAQLTVEVQVLLQLQEVLQRRVVQNTRHQQQAICSAKTQP